MDRYALINAQVYTGAQILTDYAVVIEGQRIQDLVPSSTLELAMPMVDLSDRLLTPGFIDLQLNGCGGVMFNDAITSETLDIMHHTNLKSGTTSYLPTLITDSDEKMEHALEVVAAYRQHHPYAVLGLHLEGPYLNPKRKGIHNEHYIRTPDSAMVKRIAQAGRDTVKLLTLAPERVSPYDIQLLAESGIVVSAGHSDATYEEAIAAFHSGVQMATHLFNAMSPWQGRNPGLVGAIFAQPEVYAGVIADGHHVHFASIQLAHQIKQDRLLWVTDATPPAGTQMESFWIGGQEVFYREGRCVSADGTLGGSALTMIEAIANGVHQVHLSLDESLRMASLYPARAIGMEAELGRIAPGYIANLAILTTSLKVAAVIDRGHLLDWNCDQ